MVRFINHKYPNASVFFHTFFCILIFISFLNQHDICTLFYFSRHLTYSFLSFFLLHYQPFTSIYIGTKTHYRFWLHSHTKVYLHIHTLVNKKRRGEERETYREFVHQRHCTLSFNITKHLSKLFIESTALTVIIKQVAILNKISNWK